VPVVFKSRVFDVEIATRRFPDGREHEVTIVRHRPSVVVIPLHADGRIVLIQQYRASIDRMMWEIPAGSVNDGELPDAAAARECEEEIGLRPATVRRVRGLYPTPGFCDEELIFYIASDLAPPPANSPYRPDADEMIEPRAVTVEDARAMVASGEIIDLKTAYALTMV